MRLGIPASPYVARWRIRQARPIDPRRDVGGFAGDRPERAGAALRAGEYRGRRRGDFWIRTVGPLSIRNGKETERRGRRRDPQNGSGVSPDERDGGGLRSASRQNVVGILSSRKFPNIPFMRLELIAQ